MLARLFIFRPPLPPELTIALALPSRGWCLRGCLGSAATAEEDDASLVADLLDVMKETCADYTQTFLSLGEGAKAGVWEDGAALESLAARMAASCASPQETARVLRRGGRQRVPEDKLGQLVMLADQKPEVLRMLGVDEAWLRRTVTRFARAAAILELGAEGKRERDLSLWLAWLRRYAARALRDQGGGASQQQQHQAMSEHNPWIVLRNWVAQEAIERAEAGDHEYVQDLVDVLLQPFDKPEGMRPAFLKFGGSTPDSAYDLCVTCSS